MSKDRRMNRFPEGGRRMKRTNTPRSHTTEIAHRLHGRKISRRRPVQSRISVPLLGRRRNGSPCRPALLPADKQCRIRVGDPARPPQADGDESLLLLDRRHCRERVFFQFPITKTHLRRFDFRTVVSGARCVNARRLWHYKFLFPLSPLGSLLQTE